MAIGNLFGGFISDIASGLYNELPPEVTKAFGDWYPKITLLSKKINTRACIPRTDTLLLDFD